MFNPLYLWLDFETTGLTRKDSVIEAAWMVTNSDLEQQTPLRSRLCAIKPREDSPLPSNWDVHNNRVVIDMHRESGLTKDWLHAHSHALPGLAMVRSGAALEQLILDDLGRAFKEQDELPTIMLAGAGVSHFDQAVLARHCPRLAPKDQGGILHYRCFDTSVAAEVMDLPAPVTLISKMAARYPALTIRWGQRNVSLAEVEMLSHRADSDVVWSWLHATWMRDR